jgi:putative transposase
VDLRQNDRRPKRRSIRLPGYDYSKPGAYFVSICTKDRKCLFGDIVNREMSLNAAGRMVEKWFGELENKFQDIRCDEYIIMPNHFHAIIQNIGVDPVGADLCVCPDDLCVCPDGCRGGPATEKTIPRKRMVDKHATGEHTGSPLQRVIQWFKTMTTNEYIRGVKQNGWLPFPGKLWQRNYYEHIIRNENEMARIQEYILNNLAQWATDRENPFVKMNQTP